VEEVKFVHREQIQNLASICNAWLDGDWRELSPLEGEKAEVSALYTALDLIRQRLILSARQNEDWNRKFEELNDRLREAEVLFEAAKMLTSTLEFEPLLKATTDKISEMFELTDGAAMFLFDQSREHLEMIASFGYPSYTNPIYLSPGEGAPGTVFLLREPILATGEEHVTQLYESIKQGQVRRNLDEFVQSHPLHSQSVICVPFIVRGKVIGSLQLEHWADKRTYTPHDLGILMHLADLIAIAVDNGMLWREVVEKEDRLRVMVGQLINAQEAERKRIARELHDDASQALTTVAIGLSSLSSIVPKDMSEVHAKIVNLRDAVKDIMGRMRDLTFAIRPSILDDLGLVAALKWYASRFSGPDAPKIKLSLDDNGQNLDPLVTTVLFRVAQEALNNALRYSQATEIKMSLQVTGEAVTLIIKDDGVGFPAEKVLKNPVESFGLYGMSERVALFNGSLKIRSSPGKGASIRARIPLDLVEKKE
jgi:signal transduction histidine kinase